MRHFLAVAVICALSVSAGMAQQAAPIMPETLTTETAIKPGPNLLALDQSWGGVSRISVFGADDLSIKGNMGIGLLGQIVLNQDGTRLYTTSIYPKRLTYGPVEAVVHEWDVSTLSRVREFLIPPKAALVEPQPAMLGLVDDEKYLLVQNATPATSVTVVDLAKGAPIAEIPTPGCWGILPLGTGARFMALCGDGSMKVYAFAPDGSFGPPVSGARIFDPDHDPLFTNPARMGDDFLFASFKGTLYRVTITDGVPVLADTFSIVGGHAGWAPGGSEVIGYSAATGVAFVLMHPYAFDGSHKNGAREIWSVDMAARKLIHRSAANRENSIFVSKADPPVLYTIAEDSVIFRYDVSPRAVSAVTQNGAIHNVGDYVTVLQGNP